jgi:hypothetical protein
MVATRSLKVGIALFFATGGYDAFGAPPTHREYTTGLSEEVPAGPRPCTSGKGQAAIDFGTLLHLSNKSVVTISGKHRWRVTLQEISVLVEAIGVDSESGLVDVFEIRRILNPEAPPDIDLSFALVEGSLFVYWRETYKHRSFERGLFKFDAGKLSDFCRGTGGVNSIH